MKRSIYYFLSIIIANILFLAFYFNQDIYRMFAFIAFVALVGIIPKFSVSIAELFTKWNYSNEDINAFDADISEEMRYKSVFITAISIILLAGLHVYGYLKYFKYQEEDLSNKGIYTAGIVTDKKQEIREKHIPANYIYYTYHYNKQCYKHSCVNDTIKIGDTIVVKFLPCNPDHHIIMGKKF